MSLSRRASEIWGIYKVAVYSVKFESKSHTKGRQHGRVRFTSDKVREHESIEYLFMGELSLGGATHSQGRREVPVRQPANGNKKGKRIQWIREWGGKKGGRWLWEPEGRICGVLMGIRWFSSQQINHSETLVQIKYPPLSSTGKQWSLCLKLLIRFDACLHSKLLCPTKDQLLTRLSSSATACPPV